jgi:hypothetical protein
MSDSEEFVEFVPVDYTKKVKIKVRENIRPRQCPDLTCKPIHMSIAGDQKNLDDGYSSSCYGYCGLTEFDFKKAHHPNDISHCIMTPLKGTIRFFVNAMDLGQDLWDIQRLLYLLSPSHCAGCNISSQMRTLCLSIVSETEKQWLCHTCRFRLGLDKFDEETKTYMTSR